MNEILNRQRRIRWVFIMLAGTWLTTSNPSTAQPPSYPDIFGSAELEGVPKAAMLTERGRQLANELRNLRRSRDTMGLKHPSRPAIIERIEAIEEQLEAWSPGIGEPEANPFDAPKMTTPRGVLPAPTSGSSQGTKPRMNDVDLQQLVLRLYRKIEQLEKRIEVLERR